MMDRFYSQNTPEYRAHARIRSVLAVGSLHSGRNSYLIQPPISEMTLSGRASKALSTKPLSLLAPHTKLWLDTSAVPISTWCLDLRQNSKASCKCSSTSTLSVAFIWRFPLGEDMSMMLSIIPLLSPSRHLKLGATAEYVATRAHTITFNNADSFRILGA